MYHYSGKLFYKGNYRNNERDGYWEFYWSDGTLDYGGKFVNGIRVGLWKDYDFDGEIGLITFHII
jgi:antitoxin component YwqK of YwqJK toxin-antitoxin module